MNRSIFRERRERRRQRGAVAILFGLSLAVLIGFAGLAIDLGRFFVIKTELQNAMDACALAASSQLKPGMGATDALVKARAYGRVFTTGGTAIQNKANFQSQVINIQDKHITFSATIGPQSSYDAGDPDTAKFVKCEYPLANLPIFFMRVLNPLLTTQTVSAMAAATLAPSATVCAIPVAVCKAPGSTAATNYGLLEGQWLVQPSGSPGTYGTGNFGWVIFDGPGATEPRNLLTGSGQCELDVEATVQQPSAGAMANLDAAWRSRFGVYKNGGGIGIPQIETAFPDKTGYAYNKTTWPITGTVKNAYSGISGATPNYMTASTAPNYLSYQLPLSPPNTAYHTSTGSTGGEHDTLGRLNRRVAVAPVVDCTFWETGGKNPPIEDWACVLMLDPLTQSLEYLGLSSKSGTPCATNGGPGMFGPLVPQLVQ